MQLTKKIGDFTGKNEKTKVIAKIQKKGRGAPAREPVVRRKKNKRKWWLIIIKSKKNGKKLSQKDDESY